MKLIGRFLFKKMYCLQVVIAHPDYKRPYAEVIVKHFATKEHANMALGNIKKEYIDNYGLECTIEEFDNKIQTGELYEIAYVDSYMDMEPFKWEIFDVRCEYREEWQEGVSRH